VATRLVLTVVDPIARANAAAVLRLGRADRRKNTSVVKNRSGLRRAIVTVADATTSAITPPAARPTIRASRHAVVDIAVRPRAAAATVRAMRGIDRAGTTSDVAMISAREQPRLRTT
jgi:hypothetical protein